MVMRNTRDLERLVRQMMRQKVDATYIKHYLQENYQADDKSIEIVFEKVGLAKKDVSQMGPPKQADGRYGGYFS